MSLGICEHCHKPLRRCKRVDFIDRKIHFKCIEKIKKIQFEEDYEKLRAFLASKGIQLLRS
jgi:hypothetical protein